MSLVSLIIITTIVFVSSLETVSYKPDKTKDIS